MKAHFSVLCSLAILSAASFNLASCSTTTSVLFVFPDTGLAEIRMNDREILQYRFAGVPFKPYVKELRTPGGLNVLLDSPDDHKHHHALMFALGVEGTDFWSETPGCGSQVSQKVEAHSTAKAGGDGSALVFTDSLSWEQPDGAKVLEEERTIRVHGVRDDLPTLLTWESRLTLPQGRAEVKITGAHYFGLGMRFIREMDGKATFLNADNRAGEIYQGDERLTFSRWCALHGTVGGKPVTAAMFDHPANLRHPARWFTMAQPFAYLAATLDLDARPYVLKGPAPLDLRYGVALWDGHVEAGEIETAYQRWVKIEKSAKK